MAFLKHIGKHGDKRVVIVFKTVPNEDHMCLVIYPDVLPVSFHDSIMKLLESEVGQQATDFSEALHRNLLPDGRGILTAIHQEGFLKKINTNQVIVTPTPTSSVRLDELNKILSEMAQGEEAVKRLAELDKQQGLQVPAAKQYRPTDVPAGSDRAKALQASGQDALDDGSISKGLRDQATKMALEAKQLLAESDRLLKEAAAMGAGVPPVAEKRGRGRPAKSAANAG